MFNKKILLTVLTVGLIGTQLPMTKAYAAEDSHTGITSFITQADTQVQVHALDSLKSAFSNLKVAKDAKLQLMETISDTNHIYLYDSYLIQISDFNLDKLGLQDAKIKIKKANMTKKAEGKEKTAIVGAFEMLAQKEEKTFRKNETYLDEYKMKIKVVDTEAPVISLKSSSVEITEGESFAIKDHIVGINDNVDGAIVKYKVDTNYNAQVAGTYDVMITASDKQGNKGASQFTIKVKENIGQAVVNLSKQYLGTPYVWGGTAPGGFDCSGLLQYVYAQKGISIPRVASAQSYYGQAINCNDKNSWKPGDIIGYMATSTGDITHVSMYIGNGQVIQAVSGGVQISDVNQRMIDGMGGYLQIVRVQRIV